MNAEWLTECFAYLPKAVHMYRHIGDAAKPGIKVVES